MARPKSINARISALSQEKQIVLSGVQSIVEQGAALPPAPLAPATVALPQEFLTWMQSERSADFDRLVTEFALDRVSVK